MKLDEAILAALPGETRVLVTILMAIGDLNVTLKEVLELARADAARDADMTQSFVGMFNTLLAKVEENAGNEAAVLEIVNAYRTNTDVLAAAVAANTPAAPPANPEPPPVIETPAPIVDAVEPPPADVPVA